MADPCKVFDPAQPPTIGSCGAVYIASNQIGPIEETNLSATLSPSFLVQLGTGGSPDVPINIRQRKFWRQRRPMTHIVGDITITDTIIFSSTTRELRTLKATLSATAGVDVAGFKAEISATLESAVETEDTFSQETQQQKQVTLKGGRTYAFWERVTEVLITVAEDWAGTVVQDISQPNIPMKPITLNVSCAKGHMLNGGPVQAVMSLYDDVFPGDGQTRDVAASA